MNWNLSSTLGKTVLAALTLFALSQCSEEEDIIVNEAPVESITTEDTSENGPTVLSLTISGNNTELVAREECKTCDYVVPASMAIVDGKELDIKPGQVICLDEAVKYGNLEFINMEGEAENPIIIGYTTPELTAEASDYEDASVYENITDYQLNDESESVVSVQLED